MAGLSICPHCGVPRDISRGNVWNDDGTIIQRNSKDHRVCWYEAGGLVKLIENIEALVGFPIERIVIEGKRKGSLVYIENMFPGLKKVLMRAMRRRVYRTVAETGAMFGLGDYELVDFKRGEYLKVHGRNIYCLPMFSGDLAAVFNFVEGLPADIDIEERDGGFMVTVSPGEQFEEDISSRLDIRKIPRKPGDIRWDRCPDCGMPLDFMEYRWDLDEGVVVDEVTGRHMVFTGPEEMESVLRELEAELGEEVIETIIEAQRQYIIETLEAKEFERSPDYLRRQLARRGLGNLVAFDLKPDRLEARVENALPALLIVGIIRGIFELVTGGKSEHEFVRGEDRTLEVSLTSL